MLVFYYQNTKFIPYSEKNKVVIRGKRTLEYYFYLAGWGSVVSIFNEST